MIVSIDFETRSAVDLRKTGVYVYADDPSTDIWCMAYAFDDEEPVIWTPDMEMDVRLEDYIVEGGKLRAWNSNFERVIWNKIMVERYRWPRTKTSQWHCTMAQASAMGLPRALGQAAAVLGVEEQKDKTGQGLMMRMARPRKINEDGTYVWWNTPDKVQALIDYCRQDVRTEIAVAERLVEMDYQERQVFLLDQRINDRGVMLDRDLLQRVRVLADETKEEIDAEISRITSGQVTAITNGVDLVKWLNKYGIATKSVDKQHVARMLALPNLHPVIRHALELRQNGAKSSTAKLDSMEYAAGADDRMRGLLVYHGAATGRWSGKLVQPQNFPRPIKKQDELNEIIAKLKAGVSVAEHGTGTLIASDLLRSMIIAAPGHRLLFADYSAIEARVLAWLAGQTDLVDDFANGRDAYVSMAAVVFGKDASRVTPEQRQIGKALTLGCGFGMSGKRFAEFAKLDQDVALRAVAAYREKNHRIVSYWKETEQHYLEEGRAAAERGDDHMHIVLPSGRKLFYRNPRIVQRETPWGEMRDTLQVDTLNSVTRQWANQLIWGGLAVENCIAEDTFVLTDSGWKPIQFVSDSDLVHDGVDFVSHGGLMPKSVQTCIEIDGVWMTHDHEVLTDDGWRTAQTKPRPYRPTLRDTYGYAPGEAQWEETLLALQMRLRQAVREGRDRSYQSREEGPNTELWMSDFPFYVRTIPHPWHEQAPSICSVAGHERPMPPSYASSVEELRRARHSRVRTMAHRLLGFLGRYGSNLPTWFGLRQDRQRRSVLSGELPMGYAETECDEQTYYDPRSGRGRIIQGNRHKPFHDILSAEERMERHGPTPNAESSKQVFDIRNAGPRHRFVVLGNSGPFIVHNCVQATARDLMASAMTRLEMAGYPVIMSVHDEIICEVPDNHGTLAEMIDLMVEVPAWAKGCPIAAEGKEGPRYEK